MIASMTGFGKAVVTNGGFAFEVEMKSLNNRYSEISVKLPNGLQAVEYDLREMVRGKLLRGKVYVNIQIKPDETDETAFTLNQTRLRQVVNALKKMQEDFGIKTEISLDNLVAFRELFSPEIEELTEDHEKALKQAVEDAADQLVAMRRNEGRELAEDLRKRIAHIDEMVAEIEGSYRKGIDDNFERMKERAKELVENVTAYGERLEMELALLAERADITEECVRLKSHCKFFLETLETGKEAGRKLNFLCQELHREANTISSKSLATETVHLSVLVKEEVERIREQVQNIE